MQQVRAVEEMVSVLWDRLSLKGCPNILGEMDREPGGGGCCEVGKDVCGQRKNSWRANCCNCRNGRLMDITGRGDHLQAPVLALVFSDEGGKTCG